MTTSTLASRLLEGLCADPKTGLLYEDLLRVVARRCVATEATIPALLLESVETREGVEAVLSMLADFAAGAQEPVIAGAFDDRRALCILPDHDVERAQEVARALTRRPKKLARLDRAPGVALGLSTFRAGVEMEQVIAELFGALSVALATNGGHRGGDVEPESRAVMAANVQPPTVLVVDDDESIRLLIGQVLMRSGMVVFEAPDAIAAEEIARRRAFDVAILDISLPGIDGLSLAERLRARSVTRDLPLMFLSGRGDEATRVAGLRRGDDYVTKPFDPRELVARVRNLARCTPRVRDAAG